MAHEPWSRSSNGWAAWSFSVFTVLVYYAITNLAALRLKPTERLYSQAFAWVGLISCLFLAFWVQWQFWLVGLALIGAGLVWHSAARRLNRIAIAHETGPSGA